MVFYMASKVTPMAIITIIITMMCVNVHSVILLS